MNDCTTIVGTTPAKVNLGLEVIGRRPDGYHEVVTIMQAIDLVDSFVYKSTGSDFEYLGPSSVQPSDDMVRGVFDRAGVYRRWSGRLRLEKGIPVAAGLGGGSSDAAYALRICHPDASAAELREMAGERGSDAPFFIEGGTALATGTGTRLDPLPTPELWFVLVVPRVSIASKTARLYQGLRAADFTSGEHVQSAAEAIKRGDTLRMPLPNAFARQMRSIPEVERAWKALQNAGAQAIMLSGAGPTIFTTAENEVAARDIASRIPQGTGFVVVTRTVPAHRDDPVPARLNAALTDSRRGR